MNIKENLDYCLNCKTKPCQNKCPLNNDIPEVIALMKQNKYEEAYRVLTKTTVLSSVCGRICPYTKQCQGGCTRGIKSTPVEIGNIEAFLSDWAIDNGIHVEQSAKKDKKVAVVGGGPAGLTCAAFLAKEGISVTIYEKYSELGGILSHGIPDFRLSKDVLNKTINNILSLGIEVKYNSELGKNLELEELTEKYDAVFLSFGANISAKMNIEGEELDSVYGANEVLEGKKTVDYTGKKVIVIGGGNVAMDMARTAKKNGAKDVKVIYRRSRKEMPAEVKEIEEAEKEGIEFLFQNNVTKIIPQKIECIKTELIKKEGDSRLSPVNIDGSNYLLDADLVFMAVGSKVDSSVINKLNLAINKYGYIDVDEKYRTSNEKIYAGGDLVGEKSTVAWAARSGREAAKSIISNII